MIENVEVSDEHLLDELRPYALSIAYRMLGSVADAEDVVQEALLRVHRSIEDGQSLESPRAFVATVTTRLAIDQLRSARARREQYVGEWLPEPVVNDPSVDPAGQAEVADSLSLAFLVLLESLSAEQRAALLLRDVFDYGYAEIARIVGTSEENARQLATRARRQVAERRPRFDVAPAEHRELAQRFFSAARLGDLAGLEQLLAGDVVLHGDGGGKVPALARAVRGRDHVARTLLAWWRQGARMGGSARLVDVNGQPGALLLDRGGRLLGVMALEVADGLVTAVHSVVNPDKLRHLGPVGDLGKVLSSLSQGNS